MAPMPLVLQTGAVDIGAIAFHPTAGQHSTVTKLFGSLFLGFSKSAAVSRGFFRVWKLLEKTKGKTRNRDIFDKNREGDKARTGNH